jgi:excisionase family DNA binding protein
VQSNVTAPGNLIQATQTVPLILLTPEQTSHALGISERMLWDLTNQGEIPRVKIGRLVRYRARDLEAWAARQSTGNSGGTPV